MFELNFSWSWNYKGKSGQEVFFHEAMTGFAENISDFSPAFRDMVTEVFEPAVAAQFQTEGHGTWAALAPSTVKRKGHALILMETGRLESSFTRSGGDHVETITPKSLTWGSSTPYGTFHQTGTGSGFQRREKGAGRGMPMRKILELSDLNKRDMRSILVRQVATAARRVGFRVLGADADPLAARLTGQAWLGGNR